MHVLHVHLNTAFAFWATRFHLCRGRHVARTGGARVQQTHTTLDMLGLAFRPVARPHGPGGPCTYPTIGYAGRHATGPGSSTVCCVASVRCVTHHAFARCLVGSAGWVFFECAEGHSVHVMLASTCTVLVEASKQLCIGMACMKSRRKCRCGLSLCMVACEHICMMCITELCAICHWLAFRDRYL